MTADRDSDSMAFGDLLRQHRHSAGVSQEDLAERAGMSPRGISDLERSVRKHPYRESARQLADALGLSGDERTTFLLAARRPLSSVSGRERRVDRLPVPLTSIIGRHEEHAAVSRLLREHSVRLVTLTGPGGVGKTSLAVSVAEDVAATFRDGVVFVDLSPLRDPALVLSHLGTTLGLRETGARAFSEVIRDYLAEREMLLLLDNFEHLLAAAPVVSDLLLSSPQMKILATSRAPLRLRGEREYLVPTLHLPTQADVRDLALLAETEAVALFVARVRDMRPDFALTAENAAAIAEICARLDGLPLALELAAARVKVLPPTTLLTRLDARLPLLTGGSRDAPERQRTLRDALAWSHDLLIPAEQTLFRRLGVFVGGWTLEAAEAVVDVDGDHDVLEGLASLVDKSLVRLDDSTLEPRYTMLETIREFAQDLLAVSGEEPPLQRAHAAYFLGLAERGKPFMYGAGQRVWLRRLEVERPNFRAALDAFAVSENHELRLRLAANLALFWFLRGHFAEGQTFLEGALAHSTEATPHRAEALTGLGRIVTGQGDFVAGEKWLRQSEALARSLELAAVLWQAIFQRGVVAEWEGDSGRAVPLYEAALVVARERDDPQAMGVVLFSLTDDAYRRGDLEAAERLAAEAVALLRVAGDEWSLALALAPLGAVALAKGDTSSAIAAYQEALDLGLGIDADWVIAEALAGFAAIAFVRGDDNAAAQLLGAADTMLEASHHERIASHFVHAQTVNKVLAALGESVYASSWNTGRALSQEETIDLPRTLGLTIESAPPFVPPWSKP